MQHNAIGFFVCICWIFQESDSDPSGDAAQKTQQMLTYYELDLGLNHVVRKYSEQLEEHANFLISGNLFSNIIKLLKNYEN